MVDAWENAVAQWFMSGGFVVEMSVRMALAVAFGGVIGLERESRGQEAGFRTFLLVCLGAAIAMIVSLAFARIDWTTMAGGEEIRVDPGRIAYGVMAGVGFLGAGTILKTRAHVRGLTTAAGIWAVAAIGLMIGFGMYLPSLIATLMVLLALFLLDRFTAIIPEAHRGWITFSVVPAPDASSRIIACVREAGLEIRAIRMERERDERRLEVAVEIRSREPIHRVAERLAAQLDDAELTRIDAGQR